MGEPLPLAGRLRSPRGARGRSCRQDDGKAPAGGGLGRLAGDEEQARGRGPGERCHGRRGENGPGPARARRSAGAAAPPGFLPSWLFLVGRGGVTTGPGPPAAGGKAGRRLHQTRGGRRAAEGRGRGAPSQAPAAGSGCGAAGVGGAQPEQRPGHRDRVGAKRQHNKTCISDMPGTICPKSQQKAGKGPAFVGTQLLGMELCWMLCKGHWIQACDPHDSTQVIQESFLPCLLVQHHQLKDVPVRILLAVLPETILVPANTLLCEACIKLSEESHHEKGQRKIIRKQQVRNEFSLSKFSMTQNVRSVTRIVCLLPHTFLLC
nr:uncharacterized protein LOC119718590 [Anas platyrhynchos]